MKLSTKDLISAIITFSLWAIFFVVAFFVPIAQKPQKSEFVSVKLQLAPKQIIGQISELTEPVIAEPMPTETTIVQAEPQQATTTPTTQTPIMPTTKPKQTQSTQTQPPQVANQQAMPQQQETSQTLVKSVDQLIAEQNAQKSTKSINDVDWDSLFADSTPNQVTPQTEKVPQYLENNENALSGSAATTTETIAISSESQIHPEKTNTQELLSQVGQKLFEQTTQNQTTAINIEAGMTNNSTNVKMSDGKMRQLLIPKNPEINISESSSSLIENSIENIKITFTVLEDGSVPQSFIKIENEFLLPPQIVTEIKMQLANWHFEMSNSNGQASFSYSIIKR